MDTLRRPARDLNDPDHWWHAGMRAVSRALLGRLDGPLLDVGSGPGWLLQELPPGLSAIGVDIMPRRTSLAPLVAGDASALPFADRSFRTVLALDLLEQQQCDPVSALGEMRRVLAPGGRLLVRAPAHPELYGPHDQAWSGARRFRYDDFARLIAGAGFRILRLTYANTGLYPVAALQRRAEARGERTGTDLVRTPFIMNALLRGVLELEAWWVRRYNLRAGLSLYCLAQRDD